MPVTGRPPKAGPVRNRNPAVSEWAEYTNTPYDGPVPVKPDSAWPAETKAFWRGVTRLPHVVDWSDAEWQQALQTAHVHARWVETRDAKFLPELRQREKMLGTTRDARIGMRIRWVDPDGTDADTGAPPVLRRVQ